MPIYKVTQPRPTAEDRRTARERKLAQRLASESTRRSVARRHQMEDGIGFLAEMFVSVPRGFDGFLPYLRAVTARDPNYLPALRAFDQLNGYGDQCRNAYSFERICKELNVPWEDWVGSAIGIAIAQRRNITTYITALAMPEVMKRNITEAKKPAGIEDRRMFLQSTGILPTPKGALISMAIQNNASVTNQGEPTGLPEFESSTLSFADVVREAAEAPRALPEPVEVTPPEDGDDRA